MGESQKSGVDIREYISMYGSEEPLSDTNGTEPPELSGIQVKIEVEDPEYDHSLGTNTVTAGLLRSFQPSQAMTSSQSAAEWTGSSSAIRTELRKIMEDKSVDSNTAAQNVQNVIEDLLKKNENLLAKNDAMGLKPHSRRGRPALEVSRNKDMVFPSHGQTVTFPTGHQTQGRISGTSSRCSPQLEQGMVSAQLGQLMRPKSPTRRCAIPERDKSHFSLALMESRVGCEEGEKIFHVQEHEMVCAISSQTKFLNKERRLVSSVDINYYWCNFCNFSTTNKSFLMNHIMEHRFHCKHCRYQSFSRADVIHHSVHTHPGFQDTAAITQYCTLLSDYLRIHNPSESQLDHRQKRKNHPDDDGDKGEQPPVKVSRNGLNKDKVQKSYSADFDLFDVSVEVLKEAVEEEGGPGMSQESGSKLSSASSSATVLSTSSSATVVSVPADPTSETPAMVSCLVSQPMSSVTQSSAADGGQPVITQVFSASTIPPTLAPDVPTVGNSQHTMPASTITPHASPSPTSQPFYSNSVGAGGMQQIRSNLYWSCGYCKFTSTSQSGIKEHSVLQHSGKPHRYVALIKSEERSTPPPAGNGKESTADQCLESGVTMEGVQSDKPTQADSTDKPGSDEPPVLVKLEPVEVEDPSVPIRVRFPTPRNQPKDVTILKCYHCSYTSRNLGPLRNHILNRHKGKCLLGVGGMNSIVFMCTRSDCTFRSSSSQTFLSHSQECTPWLTTEDTDEPIEGHLKKCLEATIRIAEETQTASPSLSTVSGSSSSSQVSYDLFSCLYCKCQYTWSKKQTKQHVLKYHASKCLIMRNVKAHRNRKRSCVLFCRWCPWEGTTKEERDVHTLLCPGAQGNSQTSKIRTNKEEVCVQDNSILDGCEDIAEDSNNGSRVGIITDDEDLEPPDITGDVHTLSSASPDHTADSTGPCSPSTAEASPQCTTFLSDGMPQLYVSDPNAVDSDDSKEMCVSQSSCPVALPSQVSDLQGDHSYHRTDWHTEQEQILSRTKKDSSLHVQSTFDIHRKVNHFPARSIQSSFKKSIHKPPVGKMTKVQCFMCGFQSDCLRSLKQHMKDDHDHHVSFSFRSMYHSLLHLKCRFFACPLLDCSLYRYNEGDVVSHYRQRHSNHPHPYLDLSYTPAPMKFQRRMNKQRTGKLNHPCTESSHTSSMSVNMALGTSEQQYMCLYCDRYYYSDSISDMKDHHLATHPAMPIIVRDVIAYKNKKMSRVYMCEHTFCIYSSYVSQDLEEHAATVHVDHWETGGTGQLLQCTVCGWITTDDSIVHKHLTTVHAGDNSAMVVTLDLDNVTTMDDGLFGTEENHSQH